MFLNKLRIKCNKILPLVYDNSLTYYEVLCKLTNKINEVINCLNTQETEITNLKQSYENINTSIQEIIDSLTIVNNSINVINTNIQIINNNITTLSESINSLNERVTILENKKTTYTQPLFNLTPLINENDVVFEKIN